MIVNLLKVLPEGTVTAPGVPQNGYPLIRELEGYHSEDMKQQWESPHSFHLDASGCGNESLTEGMRKFNEEKFPPV